MDLHLHNFKTISEFNYAIFKITSKLKLCGENIIDEDKLEKKTFSILYASNVLVQRQYREKKGKLVVMVVVVVVAMIMYFVELYKVSLKNEKIKKIHFTYKDGAFDNHHMDATHFNIFNFFTNPNKKI
ncbi:hypothetical protein CR513_38193, partial [Mucuna pruriens]